MTPEDAVALTENVIAGNAGPPAAISMKAHPA